MGEPLVYHVMVFEEAIPAPAHEAPYAPLGRCCADLQIPARVVDVQLPKRVPSKAEYVKLFALAGALPKCVRSRRRAVVSDVLTVLRHFRGAMGGLPARFSRVMAPIVDAGVAGAYDGERIARMRHYFADHARRRAEFEARAIREWESEQSAV